MDLKQKQLFEHHIIIADDLTELEKFKALQGLEIMRTTSLMTEAAGDDDIAAYTKYRNKLKKIGGQTPTDVTGKKINVKKALAKKKAAGGAGAAKKKGLSWGAKIAAKIKKGKLALLKKAAGNPKVMKAATAASKMM